MAAGNYCWASPRRRVTKEAAGRPVPPVRATRRAAVPSARGVRNTAIAGGLGLAAVYAYEAVQYRRSASKGFTLEDPPAPGSPDFSRLVEALTVAPLREGNRVTVLRNGSEIFPAMLDAIRAAEMEQELIDRLEESGATVAWFRPVRWWTLNKLNNRTHRKILVVDGRVGFTGGVGIAEEWTGNCEDPEHWRDTHVRVEGPAPRDLLGGFLDNWAEATQCILSGRYHLPDLDGFDDGVQVQVTRSSAEKGSTDAEQLFYTAIACARERLWLTTAYFAPRRAFVDALCEAVRRGVDVRVLVNGPHIDKNLVRRAGQQAYDRLLASGVRIFEYQRTMLHTKTLAVDSAWATVGSINFDNRSFSLNDELNLAVRDPAVVATFEKHFLADLDDAVELDHDGWRARPLALRARELSGALLRRQL